MTGTGRIQDRAAFDVLARALTRCRLDGISGALHLMGNPGGVFHLRRGIVVAVDSPGAPGADALLLRSGRVSEGDWTAALRAAAEGRSSQAELVARGSVGATELRVLSMMAARDAAFATAAGMVEGYVIDREPVDVPLPLAHDVDADSLLQETERRLNALASLPIPVAPHRERVAPVPGKSLDEGALTELRREILAQANGRRTARDLAFLISRGVYPVTVEISRLLSEGLVEIPVRPP
ncbi:MarR family transcriptional regulator, partial [Amycolatopsis rhizosphaerae]